MCCACRTAVLANPAWLGTTLHNPAQATLSWKECSGQGQFCDCTGSQGEAGTVLYLRRYLFGYFGDYANYSDVANFESQYEEKITSRIQCNNDNFRDVTPGRDKRCLCTYTPHAWLLPALGTCCKIVLLVRSRRLKIFLLGVRVGTCAAAAARAG